MQKQSLTLLIGFVLLGSLGCSSIPIRDITLYWPVGVDGAVVTHTLTDSTDTLTKEAWDLQSTQSVCMSYDAFALDVRAVIEKLCSEHKTLCQKEVAKKVDAFSMRTRFAARKTKRKEVD